MPLEPSLGALPGNRPLRSTGDRSSDVPSGGDWRRLAQTGSDTSMHETRPIAVGRIMLVMGLEMARIAGDATTQP